MIARSSLKTISTTSAAYYFSVTTKRFSSSSSSMKKNEHVKELTTSTQQQQQQQNTKKTTFSFMPVVNIPVTELAHNAFYSLHRPLLGLSSPKPILVNGQGGLVGQIVKKEQECYDQEAILQYMSTLKPFEPPSLDDIVTKDNKDKSSTTTTLTVEIDPSYFLQYSNNHDEIADYLTAMQEKLDLLHDQRLLQQQQQQKKQLAQRSFIMKKKSNTTTTTTRRLRKRSSKGFFEKN